MTLIHTFDRIMILKEGVYMLIIIEQKLNLVRLCKKFKKFVKFIINF